MRAWWQRQRWQRLVALAIAVIAGGCQDAPVSVPVATRVMQPRLLASAVADGRAYWRNVSDQELWKRIAAGKGMAVVGLRNPGSERGVERGKALIVGEKRAGAEAAVEAVRGLRILRRDDRLPILLVSIDSPEALNALRRLPHVDYVEPDQMENLPMSGCGPNTFGGPQVVVAPGDIMGLGFEAMGIPRAWTRANGTGIMVGIVDTGADREQPQIGSAFDDGWSAIPGRQIFKNFTTGWDYQDSCGHGTKVASVVAGPRDGINTLGVAWGASVYTVASLTSPWLDNNSSLVTDVREGIGLAATHGRIVSMAFGSLEPYSSIEDEIAYWYYNHDRMFIGAAGHDMPFGMLAFPARAPNVLAIAGTPESCPACSYNSRVDFVAVTGHAAAGNLTFGHPDLGALTQSSGATSAFAGIAALVWSHYPTFTRNQIVQRLRYSTQTGSHNPPYGYGLVNADCAIGFICHPIAQAVPDYAIQSGFYTFYAQARGNGPFSYQWNSGGTGDTKTVWVDVWPGMPSYHHTETVTITDVVTGETRVTSGRLLVMDTSCGQFGCGF